MRNSNYSECGDLKIWFDITNLNEVDREKMLEVAEWDNRSFTIKYLPINGQYLVG